MADELSYEDVVGNRSPAPSGPSPALSGGAKEITWEQLKGQSAPPPQQQSAPSRSPATDQAIQGSQSLWTKLFGGAHLASNDEYRQNLGAGFDPRQVLSGDPIGGALPRYSEEAYQKNSPLAKIWPKPPWAVSTLGGYYNAAAGLSDFVTSPRGLLELGASAVQPELAPFIVAGEVAPNLPQQIPQIYKAATGQLPPAESAEAGAGLAALIAGGAHPLSRMIAPGPTNLPLPPLIRPSTAASYPVLPFETRKAAGVAPTGRFAPGDFEATGPVEMQKEGAQPIDVGAMAKEDAARKLVNLHGEIEQLKADGKEVPETMVKDANMLADIIEGRPPVQEEVNTHASSEPSTTSVSGDTQGEGVDETTPLQQQGAAPGESPPGTEPVTAAAPVAPETPATPETRFIVDPNSPPGFHDVVDTATGNVVTTHPDKSTAERFAAQYEAEAPKSVKPPPKKGPIEAGREAAGVQEQRAKTVAGIAQKPLQAMPVSFTRLLSPQDQADHKALQQAWTDLDFQFGDAVRHGDEDTAWEIASMQGELKKRMRSIEKQLPDSDVYDVLTVGGGPTGATAAIYSGAEGNKTGVLDLETPGGASKRTPLYENVPGKLGQTGRERALVGRYSAIRHGAEYHNITEINDAPTYDPETKLWTVKAQMGKIDKTFRTRTLIAASGTRGGGAPFEVHDANGKPVTRELPRGAESPEEAKGKLPITGTAQDKSGIKIHLNDGSSMAVEALAKRQKRGGKTGGDMVGAGGANSAGQGAVDAAIALMRLYLPKGDTRGLTGQKLLEYATSRMIPRPDGAPQFHLIIRGPGPEMSGYLSDKVNRLHDLGWIEYHANRQIHHVEVPSAANGNREVAVLQHADTRDHQGHTIKGKVTGERIAADSVGSFIGGRPVTEWLPKDVATDARTGGVLTKENTMQALNHNGEVIPGLYAAGTVRHAGTGRVAAAEGEGGTAVDHIGSYLTHDIEHGDYYPQWKMDLRSNFNRMEAEKKAHGVVSREDVNEIHPAYAPPEQPGEKLPEPNPITFSHGIRRGRKVTLPDGREVFISAETGQAALTGGPVKPIPKVTGPSKGLPPPPSPPSPLGGNQQQQQDQGEVGPVIEAQTVAAGFAPGKIARFKNYTDAQLQQELQQRKDLKPYSDAEIGGELARRAQLTGGGAPPVSPLREMINAKAMGDFNKAYKLAQDYKEQALASRKRMIDDWQKDVGPKTYTQAQANQAIAHINSQPLVPPEVEQVLRDRAAYLEKQGIGIKNPPPSEILTPRRIEEPSKKATLPPVVDPETRMQELQTFSDAALKGSREHGDITQDEYNEAMFRKLQQKHTQFENAVGPALSAREWEQFVNLRDAAEMRRFKEAQSFFQERAGQPQSIAVPDLLNQMNKGHRFPNEQMNPPDIEGEFTKVEPRLALPAPRVEPVTATESRGLHTVEVPLKDIVNSKDVPQFKAGADENGVVEPLAGKYERVGTPPVQLWERLDFQKTKKYELISGRHRRELADRTGEKTIPAQIHREADGFDARQAARLDAELNIRDNQGSIADYANYFKNSGITQEAAEARGLLARGAGRAGFSIARGSSESLFGLHQSGRVTDAQAQAISEAAPGNEGLQRVGIKAALNGESGQSVGNIIKGVRAAMGEHPEGKQLDLLSSSDEAMKTMADAGKRASSLQREINQLINSVAGAARHPEKARALGVNVDDPNGVAAKLSELRDLATRAKHWDRDPQLRAMILKGDMSPGQMVRELSPTTHAEPEPIPTKETEPRRPPIGWDEAVSQGKEWLSAGGDIRTVVRDFQRSGKVTASDMGKAQAHLNDLRAVTNKLGDEVMKHPKDTALSAKLDDALKAEEQFNKTYVPMEAVARDTLKVLDGYAPLDEASASSYTGIMRRFNELHDRPSMLVEEKRAESIAKDNKAKDVEYKKATAEAYNAMDREFDRIKTDRKGEATIETATKAIDKTREVCG